MGACATYLTPQERRRRNAAARRTGHRRNDQPGPSGPAAPGAAGALELADGDRAAQLATS